MGGLERGDVDFKVAELRLIDFHFPANLGKRCPLVRLPQHERDLLIAEIGGNSGTTGPKSGSTSGHRD
jgi:hypothetical protein